MEGIKGADQVMRWIQIGRIVKDMTCTRSAGRFMKEAMSLMLAVLAPSSGEPDMVSLKVSNANKILIQITAYSFYIVGKIFL